MGRAKMVALWGNCYLMTASSGSRSRHPGLPSLLTLLVRLLPLLLLCVSSTATASARDASRPKTEVRVVTIHPHNTSAFTEGLVFHGGSLLESTGLNGESFLREYALQALDPSVFTRASTDSTEYVQEYRFDEELFGEGITVLGDKLYALTYKAQQVLVFSRATLELETQLPLATTTKEGWGLTTDGEFLLASDGSANVLFLDPRDELAEHHRITVRRDGAPVKNVNELEFVQGELLANVWFENVILRINVTSGDVLEQIDLDWVPGLVSNLHTMENPRWRKEAVMNGIAYDPATRHVFLTGKLWDSMFELELSYLNPHLEPIVAS